MKKFYAIVGGSVIIVFGALTVLAGEYPFIRRADTVTADAACKSSLATAIQSVYPAVNLANVNRWYCGRRYNDNDASKVNNWYCYGNYSETLSSDAWYAAKLSGKSLQIESVDGDTITLSGRNTDRVELTLAQKTAHAGVLSNCLGGIAAGNLIDFDATRNETDVTVNYNYIDKVLSKATLAELDKQGKVLKVLSPE